MKISKMSTEQLAPVLCDLAIPVSEIAMDEVTVSSLRKVGTKKTEIEQIGAFVQEIIPLVLKTHFDATCQIIATLTGKSIDEVKKQNGFQTIKDAKDAFDSELIDFFKSFVPME